MDSIGDYLANQSTKAPSSVHTEGVHLRNLGRKLGSRAEAPADRFTRCDPELYLQGRLKERTPRTVHEERDTIGQLFKRALAYGYLDASPAVGLTTTREVAEPPRFRMDARRAGGRPA